MHLPHDRTIFIAAPRNTRPDHAGKLSPGDMSIEIFSFFFIYYPTNFID
jgi:hypothetical protein